MEDFGNWHFGVVANAFGFNLETTLYGSGSYQVLKLRSSSPFQFYAETNLWLSTGAGVLLPDSISRSLTYAGFTRGDGNGDQIQVMTGWNYANTNY